MAQLARALEGATKSFEVDAISADPVIQFSSTRAPVRDVMEAELKTMLGEKVVESLKVTFEKSASKDKETGEEKMVYKTATLTA